ncbi:molybdate ABC transporter permease subunit [Campylobacter sp. 19-13652]|uniref:molybdate ABC transporter permease subunit n=1 Tax=Campylobacter sp. 19-13652 TaxID=2840180 RepID=UPI001C748E00|nr:molybdate ABC transporter permease subunit [Campylobacter sp. 19-13652]BCX78907.1 molybdenum ABC transporter permease subunit [Campylobacter sp. 19-13652]
MLEPLLGINLEPFYLSIKLSFITTVMLFLILIIPSYALARTNFKGKSIVLALLSLPIVMPPSVLGFYLLIIFSPYSALGAFLEGAFNIRLVFSFSGLVVASCIYSLPFMLQPLIAGFQSLPKSLFEASYSLGKSRLNTLIHVALPSIKPSILSALVITFAHTMGEFGVVLLIGGSVENQTKVASIAIFEAVEMLDFKTAHFYSFILLAISFLVLFTMYLTKNTKAI